MNMHAFALYYIILYMSSVMEQNKQYNAGDGGNDEFYKTAFDPDDWWKLFSEAKDDEGWIPVSV